MHGAKLLTAVAAALLAATLMPDTAAAQFGRVNYPQNDFRWVWGTQNELRRRGFADFNVRGSDGGFNCTLEGRMHPASRMTTVEIRQLENELQQSMFFIETAANTMYALEQRRDIDWAELDCVKAAADESAAELREREERARAKAEQARERRRQRQARDDE